MATHPNLKNYEYIFDVERCLPFGLLAVKFVLGLYFDDVDPAANCAVCKVRNHVSTDY